MCNEAHNICDIQSPYTLQVKILAGMGRDLLGINLKIMWKGKKSKDVSDMLLSVTPVRQLF